MARPTLTPPPVTLHSLRTAILREPQPIVEGLLYEGETILLLGRPRVGKSRVIQQLSLDLARGQSFLGHFPVPKPRRVLLVDLWNWPSVVKARFRAMSAPDESDKNIFLCTRETLAECGLRTTVADIETFVAQYDADVLIIHTWRLLVGPDENDAAVVTATLKELFYIRRNNPRLAMVLTDDLRQGKGSPPVRLRDDPAAWVESISGHHALVGHVDACFGLEREVDESGDELIVFGGVGRNPAPSALLLDEHEPTLSFAVRAGEDAARTIMTAWEFEIWGHAKILGRFTFTQLLNHVSIPNRKIVASTLRKAESHQALRRDGQEYVVDVRPKSGARPRDW